MEGGIESNHLRNVRQQRLDRFDAHNRRRVVQRRQRGKSVDNADHFVVDQHRTVKIFAAVNNAVADAGKFVNAFQNAAEQQIEHFLDRFLVGRQRQFGRNLVAVADFDRHQRPFNADTVGQTFCNNFKFVAVDIEKLIFQR